MKFIVGQHPTYSSPIPYFPYQTIPIPSVTDETSTSPIPTQASPVT